MEGNGRAWQEGWRTPDGKLPNRRVGYELRQVRSYQADDKCRVYQLSLLISHQRRLLSADVISAILVLRSNRWACGHIGLLCRVRHASHRWHAPLPTAVLSTMAATHNTL